MNDTSAWRAVLVDDLEKVLPRTAPREFDTSVPLTGFVGERISLQVAIDIPRTPHIVLDDVSIEVTCPGATVALHRVDLVPVQVPSYPVHDENYYADEPGLYPDVMVPIEQGLLDLRVLGWNSVWIDLTLESEQAGPVQVKVTVQPKVWGDETAAEPSVLLDQALPIEVTPQTAPPTPIRHIAWLHSDGLSHYYDTPVGSDLYWTAIENQIASAAEMGVTAVLTPVWTPPLDTAVGTYRTNVQLLGIWHDEDGYSFDTEQLDRFTALLVKYGVPNVEIAHLFTQWGARFAPQIWVNTADGPQLKFGWHVDATAPEYRELLEAMIPFLRSHLEPTFGAQNVLWHVSDEPSEQHLEHYRAARGVVADLLSGAVVMDALSSPDYASEVDHPIVGTNHVHEFLERGLAVPNVYYCIGQNRAVSNRFIAQKAVGHRHLGAQMYVQGATTFLQWGYNFYLAQYAVRAIDPFKDTSAGSRFASGDSFTVYPGPEGTVYPSIRHRVLATWAYDARVMAWAEQLIGRDAVVAIVDPKGEYAGERGYEAAWPDPVDYRRRRLELDRAVRAAL